MWCTQQTSIRFGCKCDGSQKSAQNTPRLRQLIFSPYILSPFQTYGAPWCTIRYPQWPPKDLTVADGPKAHNIWTWIQINPDQLTLWWLTLENGHEIVSCPVKMVIFHNYGKVYQKVSAALPSGVRLQKPPGTKGRHRSTSTSLWGAIRVTLPLEISWLISFCMDLYHLIYWEYCILSTNGLAIRMMGRYTPWHSRVY